MESAKNIYSLTDGVLREGPLPQENCSEIIDALIERFYEHPDRQQAKSTLIRAIESLNEYRYQDMWAEALKVHNRLLPPVRNECAMILLCSLHDIADINTHLAIRLSATTYRLCLPDSPGEDVARRCLIEFTCHKARDGQGHEVLAILADLLSVGPAQLPLGRDFENNTVYVWPYLAELLLDKLTPAQEVDLYRLVPADRIDDMEKAGKWTWYRLVIGADGTWHSCMPHP